MIDRCPLCEKELIVTFSRVSSFYAYCDEHFVCRVNDTDKYGPVPIFSFIFGEYSYEAYFHGNDPHEAIIYCDGFSLGRNEGTETFCGTSMEELVDKIFSLQNANLFR